LLWSHYELEQNISNHQRHMLEAVASDILTQYRTGLQKETQAIERITYDFKDKPISLQQYQKVLGAKSLYPLTSKPAQALLKLHPELGQSQQVVGSYIINENHLETLYVIPAKGVYPELLMTKSLPVEFLFPPGPVQVEVFAGDTTQSSPRIAKSHHMPPPFMFNGKEPPHFIPGRPVFIKHGLPPFLLDDKEPPPAFRGPTLIKILSLQDASHKTVATLRLRLPPPPFPGFMRGSLDQWIGALILLAGLISSLIAGNYLQRNFIGPLIQLSLITNQVKRGDLSVRIDTDTIKQPDVYQTLKNFNTMLDGLVDKEQLRHSFISNLTHDFRTPLIAQTRSLELLSKEFQERGLAEQEKLAQSIVKNNEHLLAMVNQLLEIYQTEKEGLNLNLQRVNISSLVDRCFEQLCPLAEERRISLAQEFASDFPELYIDAQSFKRVFINLIGNAIQNISKDSKIQIIGTILKNTVEVRVRDNGPGISYEEQKHLFDRYYAGSGDTRKLGSGLGLYICKVFVEAHQGHIFVESVPGEHTDFVIRLPIDTRGSA
jgi:signal transduction histidine kinase